MARKKPTEHEVMLVKDINGNEVRIPMRQFIDRTIPEKDVDGVIPQFVNCTGHVFQISIYEQAVALELQPWQIVEGAQYRHLSEPAKAWGENPPFIEREHKEGKFDSKYLLTEKQVLNLVEKIKNAEFGRKRLKALQKNGKIQIYDYQGRPTIDPDILFEDRSAVMSALTKKLVLLEQRWEEEWQIRIGKRQAPIMPQPR